VNCHICHLLCLALQRPPRLLPSTKPALCSPSTSPALYLPWRHHFHLPLPSRPQDVCLSGRRLSGVGWRTCASAIAYRRVFACLCRHIAALLARNVGRGERWRCGAHVIRALPSAYSQTCWRMAARTRRRRRRLVGVSCVKMARRKSVCSAALCRRLSAVSPAGINNGDAVACASPHCHLSVAA